MLNALELTGRTRSHITQLEAPRCALHHAVVEPWRAMCAAAQAEAGIEIGAFSAFRDFDAQMDIWNRKYTGARPLYGPDGAVREYAALSETERIGCIMVWSAIPGASRHHWGSEIDVVDLSARPPGYEIKLLPSEYEAGAVFGKLAAWLDNNLQRFGFFRPYDRWRGGIYPEPWHISYAPVSVPALEALSLPLLRECLVDSAVLGKEHVLAHLPDWYRSHVLNIGAHLPLAGAE